MNSTSSLAASTQADEHTIPLILFDNFSSYWKLLLFTADWILPLQSHESYCTSKNDLNAHGALLVIELVELL